MQSYHETMADRIAKSSVIGSCEPEKLAKKLAKTVSDDIGEACPTNERMVRMTFKSGQGRPLILSFEVAPDNTPKAQWRTKIQLTIETSPILMPKEDFEFPTGRGKLYDVLFDFRDDTTINEVADAITNVVKGYIADW